MTANIFSGHRVGGVSLLSEAHHVLNGFTAVVQGAATAINHNGIFSVDQVAVVVGEVLHRVLQGLFVAGKGYDEIAIGYKALRLKPYKHGRQHRYIELVIEHATAKVEGLVLL